MCSVIGLVTACAAASPGQDWCLCPGAACGAGREWRTLGVPGRVRSWIAQILAIHPSASSAVLVWEEVRPCSLGMARTRPVAKEMEGVSGSAPSLKQEESAGNLTWSAGPCVPEPLF